MYMCCHIIHINARVFILDIGWLSCMHDIIKVLVSIQEKGTFTSTNPAFKIRVMPVLICFSLHAAFRSTFNSDFCWLKHCYYLFCCCYNSVFYIQPVLDGDAEVLSDSNLISDDDTSTSAPLPSLKMVPTCVLLMGLVKPVQIGSPSRWSSIANPGKLTKRDA